MYKKLSGMTGTAATEAVEFDKIYKLDVVVIRPIVRASGKIITILSTGLKRKV